MVSWCTHLYKGVCALGQRLSLLSRSRARPSFFDFWVSGRPPAASEGVGPPRLKTKTKCRTDKNSLRERRCAPPTSCGGS